MLKNIRLRNLRSFINDENARYVEIKPITVLVGKNSSGKSTFLRTFPLLRQSVEAKKTGPILWYGPYVDFGSFSQAKTKQDNSDIIFFDLTIDIQLSDTDKYYSRYIVDPFFSELERPGRNVNIFQVGVSIGVSARDNKTIPKTLKISIEGQEFTIEFEANGECEIISNKKKGIFPKNIFYQSSNKILPQILPTSKFERTIDGRKVEMNRVVESTISSHFTEKIVNEIKNLFHSNTNINTITQGIRRLGVCKKDDITKSLRSAFKDSSSFSKNLGHFDFFYSESVFESVINKNFLQIYDSINTAISDIFSNVKYIAPLRATSERYYRYQDLQIDEIDSTGSNLAMVLRSLGKTDMENFSKWSKDNFGFAVKIREQGLHCELLIEPSDGTPDFNISDMGFGFSQILPIITSIWLETNSRNSRKISKKIIIFAIEQPELHLHPQFQSNLALMFCKISKIGRDSGVEIKIIIETHSKTIINTIGRSIEDKIIDSDEVSIAVFNKESDRTEIFFSKYNSDGDLENWPIGFFSGD